MYSRNIEEFSRPFARNPVVLGRSPAILDPEVALACEVCGLQRVPSEARPLQFEDHVRSSSRLHLHLRSE